MNMNMNISPYAQQISEFIYSLNLEFVKILGLSPDFKYYDVAPGERCGIISARSIKPDSNRSPADSNVRRGFEHFVVELDILLVVAGAMKTRLDAEKLGAFEMMNLLHVIPAMKDSIDSNLIYDLQSTGETSVMSRQFTRQPHGWICDITSGATAKGVIYKDQNGKHILLNT